jgi:hypothetical protein
VVRSCYHSHATWSPRRCPESKRCVKLLPAFREQATCRIMHRQTCRFRSVAAAFPNRRLFTKI